MRHTCPKQGFTLIECLVVISIVGILFGLTLAAVQSARAASRRLQCADNLRQISLGIYGFQSSRSYFPPAAPYEILDGMPALPRFYSPLLQILPFLDQGPLYQSLNFTRRYDRGDSPENETARSIRVSIFICPSDSSKLLHGPDGPNSYRSNLGPTPYFWDTTTSWGGRYPGGGGGAFPAGYHIGPSDFLDGLSNTAMESEKLLGRDDQRVFDPIRDYWCIGTYPSWVPSGRELIQMCQDLPTPNPPHGSRSGRTWYAAGFDTTWYNHMLPPNSLVPGCTVNGATQGPDSCASYGGLFGASSGHAHGVNTLFADGSVHFVKDSVSISVWRALATRAGGEAVSAQSGGF